MKLLKIWFEKHREIINMIINQFVFLIGLVYQLALRTLVFSGLALLYAFYLATPETTVYQLAQMMHTIVFVKFAFTLAVVYTGAMFVFSGCTSVFAKEFPYASGISAKGAVTSKSSVSSKKAST